MKALLPIGVAALWYTTGLYAQPAHNAAEGPLPAAPDTVVAAFLHQARQATQRYRHLEAAIGAGYRPVGPDTPNMGEHWANPRLVVQRSIDPALPAVLTYLRIDGEPILTGVAYTAVVLPGEAPPAVPGIAWHYHHGTLEAELVGQAMHTGPAEGPRLAMAHLWIWADNPDGFHAADNWTLSFLRRGLPVPRTVTPEASKALFLTTGGVDYYASIIRSVGQPDAEEEAALARILSAYRDRAETALASTESIDLAVPGLSELWRTLWVEVRAGVSERLWARIQTLAE